MQVKKFEAKTMKEALEMVKSQLGPDAIILGARDNNKGFGLLGKSSVEITAAISESSLQKRKFTESRMTETAKSKFRTAPARLQKQIVEKSVHRYAEAPLSTETKRPVTKTPYADIGDEERENSDTQGVVGRRVDSLLEKLKFESVENVGGATIEESSASRRIRTAARSAAQVFEKQVEKAVGINSKTEDLHEIKRLKEEILHLKQFVEQLQNLPRTFVHAHPGAQEGVSYDVSSVYEKLTTGGVSPTLSSSLMKQAMTEIPPEQIKNKNLVEAWTVHQIMNSISVTDPHRIGRVSLFVGAPGQGKTSALVKLAGHLVSKQKKKILILGVGNLKVGAVDQLKIYSHLLNASFDTVKVGGDWGRVLSEHAHCDYILADFPGNNMRNDLEVATLKNLLPPFAEDRKIHFVQSVATKDDDANELFRRYLPLRPDDIIFTYLDGSVNHGLIYNLQKNFNTPLFAFGTGPTIPDDFEWATRERVLDLIFKLAKRNED